MPVLAFRRAEERDLAFVRASWADSFRLSHEAGQIPMPLYDGIYRDQVIPWVLARPGVELVVAHNPEETDPHLDLHGFIAIEREVAIPARVRERGRTVERLEPAGPLVHYVFVKQAKRGLGIARGLFAAVGIDPLAPFLFSFKTPAYSRKCPRCSRPLRDHVPCATWSPLVARFPKLNP